MIRITRQNGGDFAGGGDVWMLHPIFDDSDRKRLKRTCNDVVRETAQAREWIGFPQNAIAIGDNGTVDRLVLIADAEGVFGGSSLLVGSRDRGTERNRGRFRGGVVGMGYYMRFFQTDDSPLTLGEIEAGLREVDVAYTIERDMPDSLIGLLKHQEDLYGEMELNRRGEGLADEEIDEFRERLESSDVDSTGRVLRVLSECRCLLALRVLFQGFDDLERIDPVWDWLFLHKEGLVQADAEGFYDEGGLILPLN